MSKNQIKYILTFLGTCGLGIFFTFIVLNSKKDLNTTRSILALVSLLVISITLIGSAIVIKK